MELPGTQQLLKVFYIILTIKEIEQLHLNSWRETTDALVSK